jgi:hypothetical protein
MPADAVVPLAPGLWRDGRLHAAAVVRPLTGADEALLSDLGEVCTVAERVTALLATTVRRIGTIAPVGAVDARSLGVGDRERLLLALHRHTFGPRLDTVARCPECGAVMDVTLDLDALLAVEPAGQAAPTHEIDVDLGARRLHVCFRLPDGGDQEAAARLAAVDPRSAGLVILRRAVCAVRDDAGAMVTVDDDVLADLSPSLSANILHLDPLSETSFLVECPDCGTRSTPVLDAATFLLATLAGWDALMADVDRIARRYHWGEAEILALPVARRRRYLGLCDEPGVAHP